MSQPAQLGIFGEVLFDCFPTGERILGGAPFNVAWHLQALGDRPCFVSALGNDPLGREILQAMSRWGMDISGVQRDPSHPTGQVEVRIIDHEPHYNIIPDCAYDFIQSDAIAPLTPGSLLYHGTLALRSAVSRSALTQLAQQPGVSIFLDVNLRAPWWHKEEVFHWLQQARWVKLNQDELRLLGFSSADLRQAMTQLQQQFQLEQVILTRGAAGTLVCTGGGEFHAAVPEQLDHFVDTVGAGDAFTAVYIHGLLAGWAIPQTLAVAQRFAGQVIGLRGATTSDREFYRQFSNL